MIIDIYLVYKFLRKLTTPFTKWRAYQLGVIDKEGNIIKKKSERLTIDEKDSLTTFDIMILKLKRMLEKLPAGKTRLASYAAALYLIKEGITEEVDEIILNDLLEEIANNTSNIAGNDTGLPIKKQIKRRKELEKSGVKFDGYD